MVYNILNYIVYYAFILLIKVQFLITNKYKNQQEFRFIDMMDITNNSYVIVVHNYL